MDVGVVLTRTRSKSLAKAQQNLLEFMSLRSSASTFSGPSEQVKRSKRCHDSAVTNTGALLILRLPFNALHHLIKAANSSRCAHFASSLPPINQSHNAKSFSKAANIETVTFGWQPAPPKTHSVTKCRRLIFLFSFFVISSETFSGGYQSICLRSQIKGDGWRPTDAKVSYFWDAVCLRYGLAPIWKSQSRSLQRAPLGFINSQRPASVSIMAVIKMFWSCLTQAPWIFFTGGITSQIEPHFL